MTSTSVPASPATRPVLPLVRGLLQLAAIVSLTVWGLLEWGLPFPGVFAGAGFLIAGVLIWAFFLSPRPVLRTDRFAQSIIELMLYAAAVMGLLFLGVNWVLPVLLGIVGAVVGYIATRPR